ncbi:alcohol dehydrogenase catalytic domain-containing protein [Rhizobium leguminosarum]|uniref:alcohol dehydrogenase catalytic domain-containing protein n=1 Tax=Rhizobium leguminosarum TaxID=384 RepID=UPI0015BA9735|nr:alcohol dehydrogenase catalytic domain-containing protein [Rhizobium leguminosarum]MBY5825913.1 alcohol dehydrogenase catalytic domain-containing protein [Rhizobium leguminosarum]
MKAIRIQKLGSVPSLALVEMGDPGQPGPGEIRVRIHASSLNFHDFAVVSGIIPTTEGRIPMADGAGIIEALGEGVSEFANGDSVVSCFFPFWQDGPPTISNFAQTRGDGIDGYPQKAVGVWLN